jgi:general secretion pathway protein E
MTARQPDQRSSAFVQGFSAHLREAGLADEAALRRARAAAERAGERFDLALVRLGVVSEEALGRALAGFLGLPFLEADELAAVGDLGLGIEPRFLATHRLLPVANGDDGVRIAIADPFNVDGPRALSYLIDREAEIALAAPAEIDRAIERLAGARERTADSDAGAISEAPASDEDIRRLQDLAGGAPVIRRVNELVQRAVEARASDIHIEPGESDVRVRLRIDGTLRTIETLAPADRAAITSRIKIMARLNIAERRLPQDGRAKVNVRGREIDLRVSTMPTLYGESVVLRILDRTAVALDYAALGFCGPPLAGLEAALAAPNGIILVTGPTGSGKTTTLYTALRTLNVAERKVLTVEDPIEYHLAGVNQIQVQPRIGLTFAAALRSILRQDPDIIMVGEIRDLETAEIAVQASLTGHLVLSTVHTNSAVSTLTRLLDMGVADYLLSASVTAILAQRLVRRLCPTCAAPSPVAGEMIARLLREGGTDAPALPSDRPAEPVGCPACRGTGYAGRTVIAELLVMTDTIRRLLLRRAPESEIQAAAVAEGLVPMFRDGLAKVQSGETSVADVLRATRASG